MADFYRERSKVRSMSNMERHDTSKSLAPARVDELYIDNDKFIDKDRTLILSNNVNVLLQNHLRSLG